MINSLRGIEAEDGWQSAGALTDLNRELSGNEERILVSLNDCFSNSGRYCSDSKRLSAVAIGDGNFLRTPVADGIHGMALGSHDGSISRC